MSETLMLTGSEYQDDEYQEAYGQLLIALASEDSVAIAKARQALEALQGKRAGAK